MTMGGAEAIVAALGLGPNPALRADSTIRPETLASAQLEVGLHHERPPRPGDTVAQLQELPPLSLAEGNVDTDDPGGPDLVVRRPLGEGGMGRVLLAWQRSLAREVAIKTVDVEASAVMADALVREGAIAGALEHPVIPPVHALGRAGDGRPLLVMKRIEGVTWSELVADDDHSAWSCVRPAAPDRLTSHLRILGRVADAIHFAHQRGVLHRDVKPDNVMIGRDGEVYLMDWGVAVRLRDANGDGGLVGTPYFMAPEMVQARPLDVRADVFLLGATLHVLLEKTPRHAGKTLTEVLSSALACRPVSYAASVPGELAALANDATALRPEMRPSTADEVRQRIDAFLAHRASAAIADAAIARLAELEAALTKDGDASDPRLQRLATEAQFGLAEAGRGWPDSPQVKAGLPRARRAAVRLELRRGNASAARALLAEEELTTDPATAALEAEVAAVEARLEEREREREHLAEVARDASPGVAAGAAGKTLVRFAAACGIISVIAMAWGERSDPRLPTDRDTVAVGLGVLAAGTTVAFAYRRTLTENALVRRGAFAAISLLAAVAAHRALAWSRGVPLADALRDDFFMVGAAVLGMGLLAIRGWILGAALCYLAAIIIHAVPEHARTIADVASIVIVSLVGLLGPRFEAGAAAAARRQRGRDSAA